MTDSKGAGKVEKYYRRNEIPDEISKAMGRRLRFARTSRGMNIPDVNSTVSAGKLTEAELHDVSRVRIGDLYALAECYGMDFKEFVTYLVSFDFPEETAPTGRDHRLKRAETYLQGLPTDLQDSVIALLQSMLTHHMTAKGQKPPPPPRQARVSARQLVQQAYAERE